MGQDVRAWVALNLVPGMGARSYLLLLQRFESPEAVLEAAEAQIVSAPHVFPRTAEAVVRHRKSALAAADRELEEASRAGIRILTLWDATYPPRLRALYDPPPVLYVKGALTAQDDHSVAIVGTRRCTEYGRAVALKLASDLARRNLTVVSGLARGIDATAHVGALRAKGRTIAVLGSGLLRVYPPEHKELSERVAAAGALLSEFPLHAEPLRANFPIRNRIVASLARGVVVVEGDEGSGSMITADLALEQGNHLFAVPGSILRPSSRGPHKLIRDGCTIVEDVRDILEKLGYVHAQAVEPEPAPERPRIGPEVLMDDEERRVFAQLTEEPVYIDEVRQATGVTIPQLSRVLTTLEIKGLVRQEAGKRFARAARE